MNQILYTGGKNKKSAMSDKQKIIIFFVVLIIIFAIALIMLGKSLIDKVKTGEANNVGTSNTTPETPAASNIKVQFESQLGAVKIKITSDEKIKNISYWWDEESPTSLQPDQNTYEAVITSKAGTHKLNYEITDESGNKKTGQQVIVGDLEPELIISTDTINNYVINASDDEKVEKIVIKLNGEEQEIEVNSKEFEYKVPIPQGDSIIDVTVYNLNGLSVNKKAKITNFGG